MKKTTRGPLGHHYKPIVAVACASVIAAVAAAPLVASASPPGGAKAQIAKKAKGLTKAKVIALIKRYAGSGPPGAQGIPGVSGAQGIPGLSTGAAGGALAGSYPNPTLAVSGGPCPNGKALTNVSASAALTCGLGVYTDSGFDTAVGQLAEENGAAGGNTAFGGLALREATGQRNTALGVSAGGGITTGSGNIDLGNYGGPSDSNTIRIGEQGGSYYQQNKAFIAGIDGVTVTTGVPVLVKSTGQLGTTTSSRRFKHKIRSLGGASVRKLMALRPVSFKYDARYADGGPNPRQFGLIAEQVAKIYPNLVARDSQGRPYEVRYQELPALLLAQAQRQQAQAMSQRRQLARQQAEINWLLRHVKGH